MPRPASRRAAPRPRALPTRFRRRIIIWIAAAYIVPLVLAGAIAAVWI
ncbi:MAG: hypothetical protein AAF763_12310 [Pseudomonadota bacterium]